MPVVKRPSKSREYLEIEVQCTLPSGTRVNLSTDTVEVAFLAHGDPTDSDWHAAEWFPFNETGGRMIARCLIGPGGPTGTPVLTEDVYQVFVRVSTPPEEPVIKALEQLVIV